MPVHRPSQHRLFSPADTAPVGDDTRQRLIGAAMQVFGVQGFEGASTRAIAALAHTNISSIAYHFGSKEKLYLAVADAVGREIGQMVEAVEKQLTDKQQALREGALSSEEAVTALQTLWEMWLDGRLMGKKHEHEWKWFIIREQFHPTEAFDRLYDQGIGRFLEVLAALVGCVEQLPAQSLTVRLHAFSLLGQMISFERERATVARYFGWKNLDRASLRAVQEVINEDITYLATRRRQPG